MSDKLAFLTDHLWLIAILVLAYFFIVLVFLLRKQGVTRGINWLNAYNKQEQKNTISWWKRAIQSIVLIFSSTDAEMRQKFLASGFYDTRYAVYFMPIKYALLLVGLGSIYWFGSVSLWQFKSMMIVMVLWLVCMLIVPDSYLAMRAKSLRISITGKLPYLIDLLAVCVQTGMTIEAAMNYLSKEMTAFDKDLGFMLSKANDRTKIVGLEQALEELYIRVPTNEMRSFVMTLNQSLQYGTSIYEVLTTLSGDIREVQMLGIEEKIGKLSAKMSIPLILFIMFPIVIVVAAPGVMRLMGA